MDPVIIAAIITAASKAAPSIFERIVWGKPSSDEGIQKFVSKKYSDLKNFVTPPCVKLLKFAEDGSYHDVKQFRTHLYPSVTFTDSSEEVAFDHEFEYRLRYLVATGFFTNAMGEYYITRLGAAFLAKARKERDFRDVLP
jgi:hypothetical protein